MGIRYNYYLGLDMKQLVYEFENAVRNHSKLTHSASHREDLAEAQEKVKFIRALIFQNLGLTE